MSVRSPEFPPVHKDSLGCGDAPASLSFLLCDIWKTGIRLLSFKMNAAVQRPARLGNIGDTGYCQELSQWETIAKTMVPLDSFSHVSVLL